MAANEDDLDEEKWIAEFATYEDFLDASVTQMDVNYLEDVNMARELVGDRVGLTRDQFHATKANIEAKKLEARLGNRTVLSAGKVYEDDALLRALQQREEANRNGKQASIIMIRDYNEFGQEISGYIDYAHRLATEDFTDIFNGSKRLLPRPGDLSFYNWDSTRITCCNSPNYKLIAKDLKGMMFMNTRDSKVVYVDPDSSPGDNSSRTKVPAEHYSSVIIFDHYNRRRV